MIKQPGGLYPVAFLLDISLPDVLSYPGQTFVYGDSWHMGEAFGDALVKPFPDNLLMNARVEAARRGYYLVAFLC